jgi:hypothetical protein
MSAVSLDNLVGLGRRRVGKLKKRPEGDEKAPVSRRDSALAYKGFRDIGLGIVWISRQASPELRRVTTSLPSIEQSYPQRYYVSCPALDLNLVKGFHM